MSKHFAWRNVNFRNDPPAAITIAAALGQLFLTILTVAM